SLRDLPGVREAAVVVQVDPAGERRLAAYVVADAETRDTAALRGLLGDRLPQHMIPSVVVFLEALPLTPNGKIDHRALPAPDFRADRRGTGALPPRDGLELALVKVWEDLLGVAPVGVRDNFFDLGGHSLLAVRLVSRMQRDLGQVMPLAMLFEAPTVEQ